MSDSDRPTASPNVGQVVLWLLVILSLALNIFLLLGLIRARDAALNALATVRNTVVQMSSQPIVTTVKVDQEIPFSTTVPVNQTLTVPLDLDYPLSTIVNTSINIPVLGQQDLALPIETVVPIHYTFEVPLNMEFPISMTYHLQTEIPIEFALPPELRASIDTILQQAENGLR